MRYRSMVPLNSAPDVERPQPRIRYHRLSMAAREFVDSMGIYQDATMAEALAAVEHRMKTLSVDQRTATLAKLAAIFKETS